MWTEVRNSDNVLYKINDIDALGRTLKAERGNGLTTAYEYNYNFLTRINSPVLDYNLEYDYSTGNVIRRADLLKNNEDLFSYDASNRLINTTTGQIGGLQLQPVTMTYNQLNGNIKHKDGIGDYSYSTKPNAVSYISNDQNAIATQTQDIKYTPFLRVDAVSENGWEQHFVYDGDYERVKSDLSYNGQITESRIYAPEGTEVHRTGLLAKMIQYIPGPDGICAIFLQEQRGNLPQLVKTYYPYTDHLGSIIALTNEYGYVAYEQNFDAWGRYRGPATWSYSNVPPNTGFEWLRGFTGHEHMPQFNLINMNARLYDPVIGRMLSPDNCVSDPYSTQAYNRYSYANNNPLSYVDPDGNNPIIVAAAVGAFLAASSYTASVVGSPGGLKNWNWMDFTYSTGSGAVMGIMTWGIGNAFSPTVASCINPSAIPNTGTVNEVLRGLMHGYANLVSSGDPKSFASGALGSFASSYGSVHASNTLGTLGGGLAFSGAMGGLGALATGGKFWQGAVIGIEGFLLNQSMHKTKLKPGAIINNHTEIGANLNWLSLFIQYTVGFGTDCTPNDNAAKDMMEYFYEEGLINDNTIPQPLPDVPGLYILGVSTTGKNYHYAVGDINVYFIRGDFANTKFIPVGFSDYYNFDAHTDRPRPGLAEIATTFGRTWPGKYFNIRYGLTPTQPYINAHFKR